MSASLVGSEMCIRDRTNAGLLTGCPLVGSTAHEPGRQVLHDCSLVSVSYTHLTLPTICSV
eukprot:311812-Alexandrium_andersonii.AAC.1